MSTPALRFLADEGCDFAVVRALREAGFDVVAVCEIMSGSNDSDIIKLSHAGIVSCLQKTRTSDGWFSSAMQIRPV